LLREGICTSDSIESLSPEAEVTFYRLLVVCDDYGYMDARPAILKAQCFPLKDSATQAKIQGWIKELAKQGLITVYEKDDKPFLAVSKWEQRVRSRQRYPGPLDDGCRSIGGQLSDNCQTTDRLGLGRGKGKGAHDERFERFWEIYPRKVAKGDALKAWAKANPDDALTEKILAAVSAAKGRPQWLNEDGKFIPYPATWLNRGQWDDSASGSEKRMVM
jgi:hypothetical protein